MSIKAALSMRIQYGTFFWNQDDHPSGKAIMFLHRFQFHLYYLQQSPFNFSDLINLS